MSQVASVVAPTTVVTAMLLYFGFIGTRARFAYFGVHLDLVDLSNQDLVLYGLEILYVPVAALFLAVLLLVVLHAAISWLVTARSGRATALLVAGLGALAGALLLARAVLGLVVGHVARQETPGATALALAGGPALLAYAGWIAARVEVHRGAGTPALRGWYVSQPVRVLRRSALVAVGALVVAGLFWAGTSFAWRVGEGRAFDDALQLPERPEVVLDTEQRLVDLPPFVQESRLPPDQDAKLRYRYRGLRLLVESGGRLFLVPGHWTRQGRTLIVTYDDTVRLQVVPHQPQR